MSQTIYRKETIIAFVSGAIAGSLLVYLMLSDAIKPDTPTETLTVAGTSMQPTLQPGDKVQLTNSLGLSLSIISQVPEHTLKVTGLLANANHPGVNPGENLWMPV